MQIVDATPANRQLSREAEEIRAGLLRIPRQISSKYFYDEKGSALFDDICELPEYYPTRTESEIMSANVQEMVGAIGEGSVLIELGSGSSTKTRTLLDHARGLKAYMPIDISADHLLNSVNQLQVEYPQLRIEPLATDYTVPFDLPPSIARFERRVVYFPGSTFGNFLPDEGEEFLKQMRVIAGSGGGLLIGLDWRKDPVRLEAAYNDSQGVTAAFNLNILSNVNRHADANFDESNFAHFACFDDQESRIEMYLVSKVDQTVTVAGTAVHFEADEAILTEVSYKHTPERFLELARRAGFSLRKSWTDPERLFGVLYLSSS